MIRNYLIIACRNLTRNKMFSFINIFGLALSMSVCLLVLIHLKDQLSYDTFHPQPDRTYRIVSTLTNKEGRDFTYASTPLPLADRLSTDFNIVEHATRIYPLNHTASYGAKELAINQAFADPSFFDLFGYALQSGDARTALIAPNSIVLSAATAEKFFGEADAMGQMITLGEWGNFKVTGVLQKTNKKSHLDKEAYTSMSSVALLEKAGKLPARLQDWNAGAATYLYVLLKENCTSKQLSQAVSRISTDIVKHAVKAGKENMAFAVQPLDDIILGEEMGNSLGNTGSRGKMLAEVVIAFIILLSACFNYTNLSVARSLKRGKEVGIRKVSGAVRAQVFAQFIIESMLTALLALVLSYLMLQLMLSQSFTQEIIGDADLSPSLTMFTWFFCFSVFAGLLAGILPAWALSSFKPVEVLKNLTTVKLFLGNNFRKSLLVIQFTLSLVAIIFTLIFFRQFDYMANADPGFQRDHIITIPVTAGAQPLLKHTLEQLNGVNSVAAISTIPGKDATGTMRVKKTPETEPIRMDYYFADGGIIHTLDLQLIAGSTLPPVMDTDTTAREQYVVVNELALQPLQLTAQNAVGKTIWIDDSIQVQITGVLKNFSHRGMAMPFLPMVIRNRPDAFHYLVVNTVSSLPATFLGTVEQNWKQQFPNQSFEGRWLQEEWSTRNRAIGTIGMLGFLTLITITIACLGLLGMVIYTTETRRKEIGIRKVMGASVAVIMSLLTRNFLKLLFIAGAIALPVGFLLGYFFLNIFANRITIGIDILLISFSGMLLTALITIGARIYQVAIANPADALRSE